MSESRDSGESRSSYNRYSNYSSYSSESRDSSESRTSSYRTPSYSSESRDSSESRTSSYRTPNYSSESRDSSESRTTSFSTPSYSNESELSSFDVADDSQAQKDVLMIDDLIESLNDDINEFKRFGDKAKVYISEKQKTINELKALREEAEQALMMTKLFESQKEKDSDIQAKIEELKNRYTR